MVEFEYSKGVFMHKLTGTCLTDQIGLDFSMFTVGSIVESAYHQSEYGIPQTINHDFTRFAGWTSANSLFIEPGITRGLCVTEYPSSDEEWAAMYRQLNGFLHRWLVEDQREALEELRNLLATQLTGDEVPFLLDATAFVGDSLAQKVFPDIFDPKNLSKDGLVPYNRLKAVAPGIFQIGELLVFAHRLFRRSAYLLNTLNLPFLEYFHRFEVHGVEKSILLDPDIVGLARTYIPRMEKSLWVFGPPFNDDIPNIDQGVFRLESTEDELFFSQVSRTECFWYRRNGFSNFEAEELVDKPALSIVQGEPNYLCRYTHAMVPEDSTSPTHADGAIRAYTDEELLVRLDTDLKRAERQTKYTKLWRLDGPIPLPEWKRLFADYFRDNRHVGEYLLGGNGTQIDVRAETAEERAPAVLSKDEYRVPYSFTQQDGIRLGLTFLDPYGSEDERWIIPTLQWQDDERTYKIIESMGIDVVKYLRREGCSVQLPEDLAFFIANDSYESIPVIGHGLSNLNDNLDRSCKILCDVVRNRADKQPDFVVAFGVRFPIGHRDAVVTVAGHLENVMKFIDSGLFVLEPNLQFLRDWATRARGWMSKQGWSDGALQPTSLFGQNGDFVFKREALPYGSYVLKPNEGGLNYTVNKPDLDTHIARALEGNSIKPTLHLITDRVGCRRCGEDYLNCACCKWADEGCDHVIESSLMMGLHWSDRSII